MQVRALSEFVGAEISGIDLAVGIRDSDWPDLQEAFRDHGVLVFRDQQLTEAQHVSFSRRFGPLEIHIAKQYLHWQHPEIVVLSNRKRADGSAEGIEDAGRYWHSDLSYMARPSLGSLLYAHVVPPPEQGGDTLFASMYAAYDALAESMKQRLRGRNAIHRYAQRWQQDAKEGRVRPELTAAERAATPDVLHPVVRRHPASGRPALYVNEGFTAAIDGMPEAESAGLLAELCAFSVQPAFVYRHRWRAGDLIFWDNRCVVHQATWYDPAAIRHLHRTTIACDAVPVAA